MTISLRSAVASYVTTVLACVVIARRRFEARQRGAHVGEAQPFGAEWPALYVTWISGRTVYHNRALYDAIAAMTGVPWRVVEAVLGEAGEASADDVCSPAMVERCQVAALIAMVGALGAEQQP